MSFITIPELASAGAVPAPDVGTEVPGHGPKPCKIALVSEHPGFEETRFGIPFVGHSGKLLSRLLTLSGLPRSVETHVNHKLGRVEADVESEIYCTNILKRGLKKPTFEEECYEEPTSKRRPNSLLFAATKVLKDELESVGANLLIACGDHAMQLLTGKRGITKWRGSILESTLLPGTKVLPIIHPAATLKDYSSWPLTRFDLERAKREREFKEIRRPKYTFNITPTLENVREFRFNALTGKWPKLAFDIETKNNNIACIGFAWSATAAICIPFMEGQGHYWKHHEEEGEVWQTIDRILNSPRIKFIGQNILFDLTHLAAHGIHCPKPWWDTMLAQSVIYPELEKSLAVLCSIHTSQPYYKDMGRLAFKKSEKQWAPGQKDAQLREYNCIDCVITYAVQCEQEKDFDKIVRGYFKRL